MLQVAALNNDEMLSAEALSFVGDLVARFGERRATLLKARGERGLPDFLSDASRAFAAGERQTAAWKVARIPRDLERRAVEITGPVDRKMIINALNSGADVFMADFEDSNAPTWDNVVDGQRNLRDAICGDIAFTDPRSRKSYALAPRTATLMVRPRGWHLEEAHITDGGGRVSASLVDFGLFFFHNARALIEKGSGPYFYLPKLESHLEARLWNDVFVHAQKALGIPNGTIKATVLIETLPAAFEMDEILYELRDHSAGLNCGRWDYIFSFIKTFRDDPSYVLPDRAQVTMTQPNMRAYTQLLIKTCHHRGAFAIGGMAAQIPIKGDATANDAALAKVRADKEREARDGHDGTWVAHPALVPIARSIFEAALDDKPNQLHVMRDDVRVDRAQLLEVPTGTLSDEGLRHNIRVGVQYLEAWLRGSGCVPLYHLMEDAATAEISRTQVWQWIAHRAQTDDGRPITRERVQATIDEEMAALLSSSASRAGAWSEARALFSDVATTDPYQEFLTVPAYERLISPPPVGPISVTSSTT